MATANQILKMCATMVVCGVEQSIVDQAKASAERSCPARQTRAAHLKKTKAQQLSARSRLDEAFEHFWVAYPRRLGANPKHPAKLAFVTAVKNGEKPENIIAGAVRLADEWKGRLERKPSDLKFLPMAATWLHQQRWRDVQGPSPGGGIETFYDVASHFEQRVRAADDHGINDHGGGSGERHQDG